MNILTYFRYSIYILIKMNLYQWWLIVVQSQMNNLTTSWREQVTFNEMMMMISVVYNNLNWIFIVPWVLAHWNNSPLVDMSFLSNTLSWFRAKQSLLLLLKAACLAEKQQTLILLVFRLTRQGFEPRIYCPRGQRLTITASMRLRTCIIVAIKAKMEHLNKQY
jgi:hypothetical protein